MLKQQESRVIRKKAHYAIKVHFLLILALSIGTLKMHDM